MDDTGAVALDDGFGHLAKEVLGQRFRKSATLRDEVEQILRRFRSLHNQHEDFVRVASVQQPHNATDVRHLTEQTYFQWHSQAANLEFKTNMNFHVSLGFLG